MESKDIKKIAIIERIENYEKGRAFDKRYILNSSFKEIADELNILLIPVISEKNFARPVMDTSTAITLLLKIVVAVLLLFVISMAIVAFTTNLWRRKYAFNM